MLESIGSLIEAVVNNPSLRQSMITLISGFAAHALEAVHSTRNDQTARQQVEALAIAAQHHVGEMVDAALANTEYDPHPKKTKPAAAEDKELADPKSSSKTPDKPADKPQP